MFNVNGPPKGANVVSDQQSYDLLTKDVVITYTATTTTSQYIVKIPDFEKVYKAELIACNAVFNTAIATNVQNKALVLSITELNNTTLNIVGNTSTLTGVSFCQIPDVNTPVGSTNTTSVNLFIGPHNYDSVQYYNPPINKVNKLTISWSDLFGNQINMGTSANLIGTFYMTLRLYYFQKRNNGTAFSIPVVNYPAASTVDSIFQPR
jgi:hypothetical protein